VAPLEMAGAYTVFANAGVYVKPEFISMVRSHDGRVIYTGKPEKHQALDPRVAYLMTNLMEEVTRSGTAAGIRSRGFTAPAAGKTGTSHDGWFAGYTSDLLCIVWVGFDDNRELYLEGSRSALPIWTEFMKRALEHRGYRKAVPFEVPDGIVSVQIDPQSGMPATPFCPATRAEVYIAGTQPVGTCGLHGGGHPGVTNVAGWDIPGTPPVVESAPGADPPSPAMAARRQPPVPVAASTEAAAPAEKPKKEKKGLFRRIWGVFK
jgi:penicillin-binding protein 1B